MSKNNKTNRNNKPSINNKTKKNGSYKKTNVSYYFNKFKGTKMIPNTHIIKYMRENYNQYETLKLEKAKENKDVLNFDECFNSLDLFKDGTKKLHIDTQIDSNPNISFDKLLAYAFYLKTNSAFYTNDKTYTTENECLEIIKYQIGKDVRRDNRSINGKEFNREVFSDDKQNNYEIADKFYKIIIDHLYNINHFINYDTANKIALLSCQNMFNLITDMVTLKINHTVSPEVSSVFKANKNAIITLTNNQQTMELYFKSELIMSKNLMLDPEYTCGNLEFSFLIDLKNNTFKMKQFKLDYDINLCGPPDMTDDETVTHQGAKTKSKFKPQYVVPVVLGIGGIVATPFILGALGGKKTNKKNKTNKKKKQTKNSKKLRKLKIVRK